MRGGVVALLALVAAFAGPVRLACGTSCVGEPAPAMKAALAPASESSCHKPEHQPQPAPAQDAEHCRHDHSTSIRPGSRGPLPDITLEPALFETAWQPVSMPVQLVASLAPSRLPPPWPLIRIVPLRI